MKLAEALQERADLNKRIDELQRRLTNSILVQEGDKPVEDPAVLLKELDEDIDRLQWLMAAINRTNSRVKAGGMTLTELIARRDALMIRANAYRNLGYEAGQTARRARGTEIRIHAVLRSADLMQQADAISREIRTVDNLLQETNWKTKLME